MYFTPPSPESFPGGVVVHWLIAARMGWMGYHGLSCSSYTWMGARRTVTCPSTIVLLMFSISALFVVWTYMMCAGGWYRVDPSGHIHRNARCIPLIIGLLFGTHEFVWIEHYIRTNPELVSLTDKQWGFGQVSTRPSSFTSV